MTQKKQPAHHFLSEVFPTVIQYAGLGIALYETLVERVDRPSLLFLAGGMMGLDRVMLALGVKNGRNGKE